MLSRLTELRKLKGISQIELAKILNVNQNTISRWEKGERDPNPDMLKNIAAYFNVSVDYLLGEDNPPTNKKIPKDLKKILEDEEVTLNGRMLSEDEKEQMLRVLEALYWDAKEKNKRK